MKAMLCSILLLTSTSLLAQTDIDSLFSGFVGEPGKLIKEDSTGYYYRLDSAPDTIRYYSNTGLFKLYDAQYHLLLSGTITHRVCSQLVYKGGKWTSYYPNGHIKTSGFYYKNQAIGTWLHYYPNGQLAKAYTLALIDTDSAYVICRSGSYEEWHPNGQPKVSGNYAIRFDSIATQMVPMMDSAMNIYDYALKGIHRVPVSRPLGTWMYYQPNGELERREDY